MTPQNEFKEDFQSRLTAADRTFKSRGTRGAATDPGKIFLLLGAPSDRASSREGGGPAAPTGGGPAGALGRGEGEETPGAPGGMTGMTEEEGGSQTQVWTYGPNERVGIPQGLTVEFRARSGFGYRMVSSKELEEALARVRDRYIYNSMIKYARDENGKLRPPPAAVDPKSPAKTILQAMTESKTATPDVPFEVTHAFFRAAGGQIYIPLLFEVDAAPLTWDKDLAEATLFGLVQNAEGQPVYQYEEPMKLSKTADGKAVSEMPLQLQPGSYTLFLGVMDPKTSKVGTQMIPIEVPDLSQGELVMSSVLVYSAGKQVTDSPGTPGHAFQFGQVHFTPKREMTYKKADTFSAFFFVYGFSMDEAGKPNVTGQYIFYKDGARRGQTKDEPLQANETQGIGNAEIPLGSFEPGNYKVEIKVTDQISKKTVSKEIPFTLVEG
jgi:GWxTD domain-containing protein